MRILVSGRIYPDSFARNIAAAAESMGHVVKVVDPSSHRWRVGYARFILAEYLTKALPSFERSRQRSLLRSVRAFQPDLVLITHATFHPLVIQELRKISPAKVAVWFTDHLANLGRQYLLASDLDGCFLKDPYMVDILRANLGMNAFYLPEACNPRWHRRVELSEADRQKYGCDLTTASGMYYYRARLLEMFRDYDLKLWGVGYPFWLDSPLRRRYSNIYVAELEKSKAFNAAKIVLNTMHFAEIEGVNCRLFEAAGCGAFQIAEWKPGLSEFFKPEYEVVTFRSRDELRHKVDYYLARPEHRGAISNRAYARAHREHTYEKRLQRILETLGLSGTLALERDTTALEAEALMGKV